MAGTRDWRVKGNRADKIGQRERDLALGDKEMWVNKGDDMCSLEEMWGWWLTLLIKIISLSQMLLPIFKSSTREKKIAYTPSTILIYLKVDEYKLQGIMYKISKSDFQRLNKYIILIN